MPTKYTFPTKVYVVFDHTGRIHISTNIKDITIYYGDEGIQIGIYELSEHGLLKSKTYYEIDNRED